MVKLFKGAWNFESKERQLRQLPVALENKEGTCYPSHSEVTLDVGDKTFY